MSQPASPEHAVLTRSRSLHSSVHSVASQVKPACAPLGCRQLWYSSQTFAQSTPLSGGIIVTPGTYSGHPSPPGASGKHAGGLGTAAGTAPARASAEDIILYTR